MVHIYCRDKDCRRIIHLDTKYYWNYKGTVKCPICGIEMYIEIQNGECKTIKH